LKEFELRKSQKNKAEEEVGMKVETKGQELEKIRNEETQLLAEKMARQKLEAEKRKILEDEKIRIAQLEKEKFVLQQKREEILKQHTKFEKESENVFQGYKQEQGIGFGNVRTGHVSFKKMSLLSRASSAEPPNDVKECPPTPKLKNVRFAKNAENLTLRSPSPRPTIKTGDVAAGIAGWTHRVSELDKNAAAAQTPPTQRKSTVIKFGRRATSESRTFQQIQTQTTGADVSDGEEQNSFSSTARERFGSITGLMSIVPDSNPTARLSPPISICSEKKFLEFDDDFQKCSNPNELSTFVLFHPIT